MANVNKVQSTSVCVSVCVCVFVYVYVCLCMCVYVCVVGRVFVDEGITTVLASMQGQMNISTNMRTL